MTEDYYTVTSVQRVHCIFLLKRDTACHRLFITEGGRSLLLTGNLTPSPSLSSLCRVAPSHLILSFLEVSEQQMSVELQGPLQALCN